MQRVTTRTRSAVVAIVTSIALVACSGGDDATSGSGATEGSTTGGGSGDTELSGSIRVWTHTNEAFNDALQRLADDYMAANPGVEVEFETFDYDTYVQTLQTSLPAGTEADVLQMFGTWTCGYSSNLATVPVDVATIETAVPLFFEAPLDGYTCDDALYGFPMEFNIEYGAALVNTAIAADAGIDLDAGWATWDDFTADAAALAEGEPGAMVRSGFHFTTNDAMSSIFLAGIVQQGGSYINDDRSAFTFDTPQARTTLGVMQGLIEAGANDPTTFGDTTNWVGDCYFDESCAMGLVGPWVIGDYRADFPDVVEVTRYVPLPLFEGATEPRFVADSGWGLTVSENSANQALAWDFVRFVALDSQNALRWNTESGTIPALRANAEGAAADDLVAEYPQFGPFLDILPYGQYVGDIPDRDLVYYDVIAPHVLAVLQGTETVDDALAAMEREATDSLAG
jgi:multiple sugar transport system substrate-binding protein